MDVDIDPLPELTPQNQDALIPYSYQEKLGQRAMKKNTIIHLPTGSGKTYIAVMLIKNMKKDLLLPWKQGGKRTIFLVNNVPLVEQQAKVIGTLAPVSVGGYSSENKVDFWKKDRWDMEISKYHVLVMTSQIFLNMLNHDFIRLSDTNLLIFDECHHAVDDHPMRQIMKLFEMCPLSEQPRVLGLTSTLLNANVKLDNVVQAVLDLETTFHASIAVVDNIEEVMEHSTNPQETMVPYRTEPVRPVAAHAIEELDYLVICIRSVRFLQTESHVPLDPGQISITRDPKEINRKVSNMVLDTINQIKILGLFGGSLAVLAYIIALERIRRRCDNKNDSAFFKMVITHLQKVRAIMVNGMSDVSGIKKIWNYSSEQILQMFHVLKEFDGEKRDDMKVNRFMRPLRAIIFVRQRFTAKIIYNILKEAKRASPEEFAFVRPDFIVGLNINPFNNTREDLYDKKYSQCALLKFGRGELNCLIATSVVEEGIDIPQCSLVIRYDVPLEYRSYVQSKGRARCKTASYVILMNQADNFSKKIDGFRNCEELLRKLLTGKERQDPTIEKIEENLYNDSELPPFILPSGARISEASAISLLNQYCSILPQDAFSAITPDFVLEKTNRGQVVIIYMPLNCPLSEPVRGKPMATLKSAKRSAALETCIKLYQAGELNPETALPYRYGSVDFDKADLKELFVNWEDEEGSKEMSNPGTKKRFRKHLKVYPKCLKGIGGWTRHDGQCRQFYLHLINLKVVFDKPTDSRDLALYELLNMDNGHGIVTSGQLPRLCVFPMFLSAGEVQVTLDVNYCKLNLNYEMFSTIKEFHLLVFDQVLNVAKKFVAFDGVTNACYIVPTFKGFSGQQEIDWDVLRTYKEIPPVIKPNDQIRKNLTVTKDYKHSVVSPWYRGTLLPDRYIVSNVLKGESAKSNFDKEDCGTYEDYYSSKYDQHIMGDPYQPLLEVKQINSRLNCLLPRAATLNLSGKQLRLASAAQGEEKPNSFKECLIAEFCIKYDFPGELWYKATVLPSVMHRVSMLLVANELRMEIAAATGLGPVLLGHHKEWKPLTLNKDVATDSVLGYCDLGSDSGARSIDRINGRGDCEPARPPHVTMKESLFQLQLKKIAEQYPWEEFKEPVDIFRNLTSVTLMDIECYDEFMLTQVPDEIVQAISKPKTITPAIAAPPVKYNDKIRILSIENTKSGVELSDLLTALTVIKAHDTFNLERTETLGDSFLKFAATLYLFHKFPALNEGQLTNIKGRLIGNRNLFYAGRRVNLGGRMKVEAFSPRNDFTTPAFSVPPPIIQLIDAAKVKPTFLIGVELSREEQLSGKPDHATMATLREKIQVEGEAETEDQLQPVMQSYLHVQLLPDKVIADCVESLVGVYLLNCGLTAGVRVLEWLRVLPRADNFESYLSRRVPTAISEGRATEPDVDFLLNHNRREVEGILGYTFRDPSLLLEALSHPSYNRNRLTRSYERLELLGDAVLDFLVTACVFEAADLKPGQLTDLRSALVNNITFAGYVVKLGLHKYLLSQINPTLERAIATFVQHQEQRQHNISEDVLYLIEEADCNMAQYVEVPKVLSDLFESLAGAIFLDSGGDLSRVWSVYYAIMYREIDNFSKNIPIQPVRLLYEMVSACPHFGETRRVSPSLPHYMSSVTVTVSGRVLTVHGFGTDGQSARRAAAKLALRNLQAASNN